MNKTLIRKRKTGKVELPKYQPFTGRPWAAFKNAAAAIKGFGRLKKSFAELTGCTKQKAELYL